MPKITLEIPDENVALFMEITEAIGINKLNIVVKDNVPEWHKQVLNERMENYKAGKTTATSWKQFADELDKEDADEV